jgi:hypothetical protein
MVRRRIVELCEQDYSTGEFADVFRVCESGIGAMGELAQGVITDNRSSSQPARLMDLDSIAEGVMDEKALPGGGSSVVGGHARRLQTRA